MIQKRITFGNPFGNVTNHLFLSNTITKIYNNFDINLYNIAAVSTKNVWGVESRERTLKLTRSNEDTLASLVRNWGGS